MQINWKNDILKNIRLDEASWENEFEADPKNKRIRGKLQCTKCGKLMSKGEFFAVQKCPDCGGGMFKAVYDYPPKKISTEEHDS